MKGQWFKFEDGQTNKVTEETMEGSLENISGLWYQSGMDDELISIEADDVPVGYFKKIHFQPWSDLYT